MRRVAVTGLGIISPIGNTIPEYLSALQQGVCGIDYITRFDTADLKVKIAAEVKNFNSADYIEPNEARKMDLFCQYAIAAATQAVADSGIQDKIEPERFGVYVGSGIGGIATFAEQTQRMIQSGPRRISPFFVPMMIANMASGHIAMRFNAQGPCLPVVTACATSTHAIGEAFRAIKYGQADAILAGGAEAPLVPLAIAGFTNCMALSMRNDPSSSSIPFDKRRDGFVMGEGAAVLLLEEYEHALRRGAKIYCEIAGYGNTCDAYHITAPHPEAIGATRAMDEALKEAGYTQDMSLYINTHGTSTPLNDKTETLAIKKLLGQKAYSTYISSTKSMTGHMMGAAGGAEAIATVLAISQNFIPPTVGYAEKDEDCDLNYTPNQSVQAKVDMGLSVSMGFGGNNGAIVFKRTV